MHDLDTLTAKLEAVLSAHDDGEDASHDVHHSRRVKANALAIAARERAGDAVILIAAAYLHDIVNLPKNSPRRAEASRLSAEAAGPILRDLGFDAGMIAATRHAIAAHSFSAGIAPETMEARILQDADRLEAIGALGIARVFYIAGKLGSRLFEGDDPFAAARPLDDKTFAVDHFAVKLLRLAETMQTASGRAIAVERSDVMRTFLDQLGSELGHACHWPRADRTGPS
jgi:uncharacterized protein